MGEQESAKITLKYERRSVYRRTRETSLKSRKKYKNQYVSGFKLMEDQEWAKVNVKSEKY